MWAKLIRDILILPFTVVCIIPYGIYEGEKRFASEMLTLEISGSIFFACGLLLFGYTVVLFAKTGKGTLAPWSPTQKLVVQGPYRHCRNPMITGVLFMLIGEGLFLHSPHVLVWAGLFFMINSAYFILSEEPGLEKRFGDEYKRYEAQVPRWIPRIKPFDPRGHNVMP